MLQDSKIVYIFLYVNDMARSRSFFEKTLGLTVLEEDDDAVKFDAGGLILALNRAGERGVPLNTKRDDTSIVVFYTEQIHELRAALEKRGLEFSGPIIDTHVGAITTFYDPDGHSFSLYQSNEWSKTRESWSRIAAILDSDYTNSGLPSPPSGKPLEQIGLGASKVVYLFLFIRNFEEGRKFYEGKLGMQLVEVSERAGVCKYDVGGLLLATHEIEAEAGARATVEDLLNPRTSAPVFYVNNFDPVYKALLQNQVSPTEASSSRIGKLCRITDPNGHQFYVYEASLEALAWPSGAKIRRIVEAHAAVSA